jgi:G3E family GTPase
MPSPPARIPVCLVTGVASADKQAFIRALLAARPADERWAVLDNDGGDIARDAAAMQLAVAAVNGCACCTAQVALQAGIAQLARQSRPQRLIIAVAGVAEPAALEHTLQQEDLARGITIDHRLCVVAPQLLTALPSPARDLLQRQIVAADHVVAASEAAAATLHANGITGVIQIEEGIRLVLANPTPASSDSSQRIAS